MIAIRTSFSSERNERSARRSKWPVLLIICVFGGMTCLLTGLMISLVTALGLIRGSHIYAYITVAALLGFFILMFLAAHAMDRWAGEEKARRREEFQRRVLVAKDFTQ